MKTNKEMLSSILKTAQMGQVGIRCVQPYAVKMDLQKALAMQLKEYDSIENEVRTIADQRGWQIPELNNAARTMSRMMTRMQLRGGNPDSKIAGMMIQGNTRGMILGLRNMHQYSQADPDVSVLAQRLLDTETANIRQMKPYL